jgi:hypothetical protein
MNMRSWPAGKKKRSQYLLVLRKVRIEPPKENKLIRNRVAVVTRIAVDGRHKWLERVRKSDGPNHPRHHFRWLPKGASNEKYEVLGNILFESALVRVGLVWSQR